MSEQSIPPCSCGHSGRRMHRSDCRRLLPLLKKWRPRDADAILSHIRADEASGPPA